MKKLSLITLFICLTVIVNAQEKGKIYLGGILHDNKEIGGSVLGSFKVIKFLSAGIGVDATRYMDHFLAPVYGDVGANFNVGKITPFVYVQAGIAAYQKDHYIEKGTIFGQPYQTTADIQGRFFYGGGAGISYDLGLCAVFAQYTVRNYSFYYDYADGGLIHDQTKKKTVGIAAAGIAFYIR